MKKSFCRQDSKIADSKHILVKKLSRAAREYGMLDKGIIVALSGGLLAQYQGFADVAIGRGAIVIGLASIIIGEVLAEAFFGKHMTFWLCLSSAVIGGILYYIIMGVVLWLKLPTNDMKLFTAIIVAIFLAVPYLKKNFKNSFLRLKLAEKNA